MVPHPNWLSRVAVACAAVLLVLLVSASMADRLRSALPPSVHARASRRVRVASALRAQGEQPDAPVVTAVSLQLSGIARTPGTAGASTFDRSSSAPAGARLTSYRRDGRLRSALTRAPPTHR